MSDLLETVIEAHGGPSRWKQFETVSAHLVQGGALWALKGHPGVIDDVFVTAKLHEEWVSHRPFGAAGRRSAFTPERVAIETDDGTVVEALEQPRASFAGHTLETPWTTLQLAYFVGTAMWTYLTQPFIFALPDFNTVELGPWEEAGEQWRRLGVEWPSHLATHSTGQTLYFGDDGLIRRHDYDVEIMGGNSAAHYISDYTQVDGIMVPSKHRIFPRTPDGQALEEPLIVSIDVSEVTFRVMPLTAPPETFVLGGTTTIRRLGFGTMQLPGPGVWGPPRDHDEAIRVLRHAVERGVTFIDTADSYGPFVAEQLIREALHPYPADVAIATKAGLARGGPGDWRPLGWPEYLRQQCELSLRHLGLERIELLQLHRVDPKVPLADQVGELTRLQEEGKIRHIGLSEVTVEQLEEARRIATIASVQNLYNLADRSAETLLEHAEAHDIGFIPWFPLATGTLAGEAGPLARLARQYHATPSQLALAWLLTRSPVMLPIPGTSSIAHLDENLDAGAIHLTDDQYAALDAEGATRRGRN